MGNDAENVEKVFELNRKVRMDWAGEVAMIADLASDSQQRRAVAIVRAKVYNDIIQISRRMDERLQREKK